LDEAIGDYSRSLDLRPTAGGFLILGHALEGAGRPADALAAYQQALKLSPDMAEAQHAVNALAAKPK
jgi:cytochrome c-type biogenesis protein CcmH/NrfG